MVYNSNVSEGAYSNKINKGDKFVEWTVLGKGSKSGYILCQCSCGVIKEVYRTSLLSGRSTSCGHRGRERSWELYFKKSDEKILNKKFGRLTPIKRVNSKGKAKYLCVCDCGKEIIVFGKQLTCEGLRSCGCLKKDVNKESMDKIKEKGRLKQKEGRIDGTNVFSMQQKLSKNSTSGIKGVSLTKKGKYRAYIFLQGKQIHLGAFDTLEDAAKARAEGEDIYFKPYIKNFENKL